MRFLVAEVEREADTGLLVAWAPGMPGAHTQAETMDALRANLREVVGLVRDAACEVWPAVALLQPDDGLVVAYCIDVGTVSQGRTTEEALDNLGEATELYLEEFPLQAVNRGHFDTQCS